MLTRSSMLAIAKAQWVFPVQRRRTACQSMSDQKQIDLAVALSVAVSGGREQSARHLQLYNADINVSNIRSYFEYTFWIIFIIVLLYFTIISMVAKNIMSLNLSIFH